MQFTSYHASTPNVPLNERRGYLYVPSNEARTGTSRRACQLGGFALAEDARQIRIADFRHRVNEHERAEEAVAAEWYDNQRHEQAPAIGYCACCGSQFPSAELAASTKMSRDCTENWAKEVAPTIPTNSIHIN